MMALMAGLVAGRFLLSPEDAAAGAAAPAPGLVTVPVELSELSNDVTIRGEVGYADPVAVDIDTTSISGPAVITGQVPAAGSELRALSVALEIAGRPVIVLPGELPAYRTLRAGVSGPDVSQFKQAMREIGLDAGDPGNNVFDTAAAAAVTALYAQAGYPGPTDESDPDAAVRSAQDAVRAAEQAVRTAQNDLNTAKSGPGAVEVREADNAVNAAQRELDAAITKDPSDAVTIENLRDALALAQLKRQQLDAPRDTTPQQGALDSAFAALSQARESLDESQQGALPFLPASEVLYLTQLPRRVDTIEAARGEVLKNPAMTVSGATIAMTGSAAQADADLLEVGQAATFEMPDGTQHAATISTIAPAGEGESRPTVTLSLAPLSAEKTQQLQGANVRVSIPVGATGGPVLNVPAAALTAGAGGEARVEVVDGDPRDGERARTRLVTVETGLAADGAVEIRPIEGELEEGDLVVVGR